MDDLLKRLQTLEAREATRQSRTRRTLRAVLLPLLIITPIAALALPTRNIFTAGDTISAGDVNQNFETLWTELKTLRPELKRVQAELENLQTEQENLKGLQTELQALQTKVDSSPQAVPDGLAGETEGDLYVTAQGKLARRPRLGHVASRVITLDPDGDWTLQSTLVYLDIPEGRVLDISLEDSPHGVRAILIRCQALFGTGARSHLPDYPIDEYIDSSSIEITKLTPCIIVDASRSGGEPLDKLVLRIHYYAEPGTTGD